MFLYKDVIIGILKGDITKMDTDGIVNAANNTLLGGGGVDGAIHRAGGDSILEQCKKIGGCPTGEARITVGGNLKSKYVIHTVGPIYSKGVDNESKLLYSAYYSTLKLANEYELRSISFPSISTGAYGYPIKEAVEVVYRAVTDYIDNNKNTMIQKINFVLFSELDYDIYLEYFKSKMCNLLT